MPRYLGVDYGARRVGLACSDEAGLMAFPLAVQPLGEPGRLIGELLRLCDEKHVDVIVVGLPLNMDGSRGPAAEHVLRFVEQLRSRTDRTVDVWDERLSSRQAERVLISADVRRSRRKGIMDQLAAQVVLQSYLEAHGPAPGAPAHDEPAPV